MTNPNPTVTEPRWIPAASKPGGLVRGDVVKEGDEEGIVLIPGSDIHPPRNALCWFNPEGINDHSDGGDSYTIEVYPGNLLVRIDPPAQLPESTDAFRQGYRSGWSAAADWVDNGGAHGDPSHYTVIDAVVRDLRYNTPTPTEADDGE